MIAEILQKYGWTYQDYLEQPEWLLQIICDKMNIEGEYQKKKSDEIESKIPNK